MSETEAFQVLIERVCAGDAEAAAELVRRYEPMVRRAARVRLVDPRLGRVLDSMDICQSVMASFFVRAALGQYELNSPDQLLKLLATMARNKLANQAHGQRAAQRDLRRVERGGDEAAEVAGHGATPSREVSARELLNEARERGDLYAAMNLSTYILSIVRLAAADPEAARDETRRVTGQWSRQGYHVQHNDQVWASVQIDLYRGDGPAALRQISAHWRTLTRSLLMRVQFIRVAMLGLHARCALASGDRASLPSAALDAPGSSASTFPGATPRPT